MPTDVEWIKEKCVTFQPEENKIILANGHQIVTCQVTRVVIHQVLVGEFFQNSKKPVGFLTKKIQVGRINDLDLLFICVCLNG